jgi:thiosulfate reductase / polysulfide reductase chain A
MSTENSKTDAAENRRATRRRLLLGLGGSLIGGGLLSCASDGGKIDDTPFVKPTKEQNLSTWQRGAATPYQVGDLKMPGVCSLPGPYRKVKFPDPDKYKNVEHVHGMCQLCSTVCGITGIVKDGRIIKIEGNPADPNSRGKLCARGQAGLNHQYHPERLLHPIRRVGKRGEGKWKRVSWDEALNEVADRMRTIRRAGQHEEFAFHQGRNRSKDAVSGFVRAFGTNTQLNHRGLCSAARRAANLTYLFESDWDLGDYEHAKYVLNFGSNMFEAHQGHIPGALRLQRGRFNNGAKLVTFDVRMSNTAGNSDEFFMPAPGTDGAVALAMAHVILKEKLYNQTFFQEWANCSTEELWEQMKGYTPKWAEKLSTVPAADITRIAREFAAAAPRATTMCNRGSSAHHNGYWNDRAIGLLNVLVGSVGEPGGWCWMYTGGYDKRFVTLPKAAPKPKTPSLLADPPEFVLANRWNTMRVGEIVYWYLKQERARLQLYMSYNLDSPLTWPETDVTKNVLLDESKINFHVCINPFFNETASFADLVLPWTTYMERWDVDARGAYNLKPYVSMRRPMVKPLGESRDVRDVFGELARRVGDGMEKWYPEDRSTEDYMREAVRTIPYDKSKFKSSWDYMEKVNAFEDPELESYHLPYLKPLTAAELAGSKTDPATGIITKDGKGIGIMHRGKPVIGFRTPSRKLEVHSEFVQKVGRNEDVSDLVKLANSKGKNRPESHRPYSYEIYPWPQYVQIDEHVDLDDDQLIMTSFKWNVHNHGRTANLKWLSEIVHSNPAWVHPDTAKKLGLKEGDWIELTGHRSKFVNDKLKTLNLGEGEIAKKLRIPVRITKGIHPRAIAISNSLGHQEYTSVAQAKRGNDRVGGEKVGMDLAGLKDADWERNMWWEDRSGGNWRKWQRNTGNGWAQNQILPIAPDYISGQQSFNDTVVRVKKLEA